MLLGIQVTAPMIIAGGLTLLTLLVFQVLLGLRKIAFKGKTHMRVHKGVAYVMLAGALVHGLFGLALLGVLG